MRSLYLDTARLGQTSPSALQAQIDFARLTVSQPSGLYFDQFLASGFDTCPETIRRGHPGLKCWAGVGELKHSLKRALDAPARHEVELASRSSALLGLAVRKMLHVCRNVLVTDCSWPTYGKRIIWAARHAGARVTEVRLRKRVFREKLASAQLAGYIADQFNASDCDGLFLPAVDHLGVRFPVHEIVRRIRAERGIKYVIVDGAQAVGHLDSYDFHEDYDVLVGGFHKWLSAYQPLGFALFRSANSHDQDLTRNRRSGRLSDPLYRFTREIEGDTPSGYLETTNIAPLFSARGALKDHSSITSRFSRRRLNAKRIRTLARKCGWKPTSPHDSMATGIQLLNRTGASEKSDLRSLRQRFASHGVSATTYKDSLVRLSMPSAPFGKQELEQVQLALTHEA